MMTLIEQASPYLMIIRLSVIALVVWRWTGFCDWLYRGKPAHIAMAHAQRWKALGAMLFIELVVVQQLFIGR